MVGGGGVVVVEYPQLNIESSGSRQLNIESSGSRMTIHVCRLTVTDKDGFVE